MSHLKSQRSGNAREKVGLALSGGGFRAALFHIGVLARMAELGLLRHVAVISTVSGGSIVGALYYLHVKKLLEAKPDTHITDDDYRHIVATMETSFLRGVQKNLRTRTLASAKHNWRMRLSNYSPSVRIAELYDHYFYNPVLGRRKGEHIALSDLKIQPVQSPNPFRPRIHNQQRSAKVPILLINATSLNTGRNWRFEATRIGEPPRDDRFYIDIDKVTRLKRPPDYDSLPEHIQQMSLGEAVAASAAFPGLFAPLPITHLYPQRRLQLVDGGIHDNQGVQGLRDEDCTHFIVSDASGQMMEIRDPSVSVGGVLYRSNGILANRVREEQLLHLRTEKGTNTTSLIHMRKGIQPETVPYNSRDHVSRKQAAENASRSTRCVQCDPTVQMLLSTVRTDLDCFTDVEAYSLMQLGYTISEHEFHRTAGVAVLSTLPVKQSWHFHTIQQWMKKPTRDYIHQLRVAAERLFKVFRLVRWLRITAVLVLAGIVALLFCGAHDFLFRPHTFSFQWKLWPLVLVAALGVGVGLARLSPLQAAWHWLQTMVLRLYQFVLHAIVFVVLAPFFRLSLLILDPLFLHAGKVKRLQSATSNDTTSSTHSV